MGSESIPSNNTPTITSDLEPDPEPEPEPGPGPEDSENSISIVGANSIKISMDETAFARHPVIAEMDDDYQGPAYPAGIPGSGHISHGYMGEASFMVQLKDGAARLVRAMDAMPDGIGSRIFVTDLLERDAWRDLCASMPVAFTAASQKRHALECVATGGTAWFTPEADQEIIPGAKPLSPQKPIAAQLRELTLMAPDSKAIETIRENMAAQPPFPNSQPGFWLNMLHP